MGEFMGGGLGKNGPFLGLVGQIDLIFSHIIKSNIMFTEAKKTLHYKNDKI